jgi:hypothetical protein
MDEAVDSDDATKVLRLPFATTPEDTMNFTAPLSLLGDRSLWSEDVIWLAENRAWHALGHLSPRIRWAHLYLEPTPDGKGVLSRIQLDLAGQNLASACAVRACPQSAICASFDLLRHDLEHDEPIAV